MEYKTFAFPDPMPGSGVTYTYKEYTEFNDEPTGEFVEFRFPMGKAPREFYWDYGRLVYRKVLTAPSVHVKHA